MLANCMIRLLRRTPPRYWRGARFCETRRQFRCSARHLSRHEHGCLLAFSFILSFLLFSFHSCKTLPPALQSNGSRWQKKSVFERKQRRLKWLNRGRLKKKDRKKKRGRDKGAVEGVAVKSVPSPVPNDALGGPRRAPHSN